MHWMRKDAMGIQFSQDDDPSDQSKHFYWISEKVSLYDRKKNNADTDPSKMVPIVLTVTRKIYFQ